MVGNAYDAQSFTATSTKQSNVALCRRRCATCNVVEQKREVHVQNVSLSCVPVPTASTPQPQARREQKTCWHMPRAIRDSRLLFVQHHVPVHVPVARESTLRTNALPSQLKQNGAHEDALAALASHTSR